jgi:hypothetical protein
VELTRLLALARLTPAQALEIGTGVLAASEAAPGGADPVGDQLVDPVVAADGRVVLGSTPSAAGTTRCSAVLAVLADVAAAARLPGPAADPAAERLLAELDRAVRDLPADGVPVVARRLQEAAAATDRAAVRSELGALVLAVGGSTGAAIGVARSGERPVAARAEPRERAPRRRSAVRRIGAWLLSILVLAAVVVSEVVLLRDDITADIGLLLDAGRSGDRPSAARGPATPHVAAPAPRSAGSVAEVDLRPLGRCAPGAPCPVRLLVRLVPGPQPQVVTWSYRVVDPCTGTPAIAPGGSVTVPPQADRVAAMGTVPLPPLDSVAVVAVTDAPATAASQPVVVGSCRSAGPNG